jgi:hypothetical protein
MRGGGGTNCVSGCAIGISCVEGGISIEDGGSGGACVASKPCDVGIVGSGN